MVFCHQLTAVFIVIVIHTFFELIIILSSYMKKYFSALVTLALLFFGAACVPQETNTSETGDEEGKTEISKAPSVTVGADNISAISVVLKGKANLNNSAASDLKVGFQYSKSAGILPSNSISLEAEDADAEYHYTTSITGLEPETTYYFRSFVRQNNVDLYGETKSFTTKNVASLLETLDASEVEPTSAALNAKLDLTDVLYKDLVYGFYWGKTEQVQNTWLKGGQLTDNAFSAAMTSLPHKTQYWYKAYVKLDNQTFYGETKAFTTDVIKVVSVSLDRTSYTFNTIGYSYTLKATILPEDATDKSVEWTSNNLDVVSVNQNGWVYAKDNGTATITATTKDQGLSASCTITVFQYVTGITLNKTISRYEGDTFSLSAVIEPECAANKTLIWTSSNESIVKVNEDGMVTAISSGKADITAAANDGSGKYAICNVSVFAHSATTGEIIDMGLSVKWAGWNLGATKPEDGGDLFAWGETSPKQDYSWSTYKWCEGSSESLTKYNTNSSYGIVDNKTEFKDYDYEDDAARVNLGDGWRIPTEDEWGELKRNCSIKWIENYDGTGARGILLTSRIDGYTDKAIFLPVRPGVDSRGLLFNQGSYWSSSLCTDFENASLFAQDFTFQFYNNNYYTTSYVLRYAGIMVRPVYEY